ncbi:type VI secretion system tube protein TssD [Hymenobacter negativus]|uniref:Uncharacterized protein n=1 Tax=Hymenobacter negativus TaxID=2795026 RepID=A0ABS3QGK3_9BACT|nr:type VI secretion system tube protein TssD [Hymenobacter negativus]MBO2010369.1 hypothetical protein [Hymenobacter negativus]
MASFSAELCIVGYAFPVLNCTFGLKQATYQRGLVDTKVRYELVELMLSVPDNDVLLAWANDPHKHQAATVVFLDANGGQAIETLQLAAAIAVAYAETFHHGDGTHGAYVCALTLSDPMGWTIQAGGPVTAFAAPAAREHGLPSVILPKESTRGLVSRPLMKNEADPIHDLFGPGRLSHSAESAETLGQLQKVRSRNNSS